MPSADAGPAPEPAAPASGGSAPGRVLFASTGPNLARPESGAGARLHHLSRELADRGWEVVALLPEAVAAPDGPDWVAATYTYEQWSAPFLTDLNPRFVRATVRVLRAEAVDVVHLSAGVCATRGLAALLAGQTRVVYAAQNVEAEHARDFVAPDLPAYKRLLGPRLIPWIERATVGCAHGVTTVSERDRAAFRERYGVDSARVAAVPTGTEVVDRAALEPRERVRERLGLGDGPVAVFHGTHDHPPNREAVSLLRERIAPRLRGAVTFLLVGRGMPESDAPNVHSAGFVEDLHSVLGAADLAVAPIRHGGGTKTKLYDYVSLGLPVVATTAAVRGIDLADGEHGVVCEAVDDSFVDAVRALAADPERREAMRERLAAFAREHTWARSAERLAAFYGTLA